MQTRTNDNKPGGRDLKGHSGVQPWSQGDIFPYVIPYCEQYSQDGVLMATWHEVLGPGAPHPSPRYPTDSAARAAALRHLGRTA